MDQKQRGPEVATPGTANKHTNGSHEGNTTLRHTSRFEALGERVLDAVAELAAASPNETADLVQSIEKCRRAFEARRPALGLLQLSHVLTLAAWAAQRLERGLSREVAPHG